MNKGYSFITLGRGFLMGYQRGCSYPLWYLTEYDEFLEFYVVYLN